MINIIILMIALEGMFYDDMEMQSIHVPYFTHQRQQKHCVTSSLSTDQECMRPPLSLRTCLSDIVLLSTDTKW